MGIDSIRAFKDLQHYVHHGLYNKAKSFYCEEALGEYAPIVNIDKENHIVESYEGTYSLEYIIKGILETKIENCVSNYEALILEDIHDSKKVQNYKNFFSEQTDNIFNSKVLSDFKFLSKYRDTLQDKILKYPDFLIEANSSNNALKILLQNPLIVNSGNFPLSKIKRLYHLLTIGTNPFIETEEIEFISAFSGKEVTSGIKWLVKGTNKEISKPSLFYLIEKLVEKGFINKNKDSRFLKRIVLTLFRDENGNRFESGSLGTAITNHRNGQNKSNPTTPTRKIEIDNIIFQL